MKSMAHLRCAVPLSCATLSQPAPFPELPNTDGPSTFFVSLFPTLQVNVTRDCAWWMRVLPDGVRSTKVTLGVLLGGCCLCFYLCHFR